jgi:SagB-type dehydrogenase family enzyme
MSELARISPPSAAEELRVALADLTPSEQSVLARMLMAAKFDENGRVEIDEISIVREFMLTDPSMNTPSQPPGGMPPIIKPYTDRLFVPFPKERVEIDAKLADVIKRRKSHRDFKRQTIDLKMLATLLETGYGLVRYVSAYGEPRFPFRRAPSSGGLQSIEVYAAVNDVQDLAPGVYHYQPERRGLTLLDPGLVRRRVVRACLNQDWIGESGVVLFLTCDLRKLLWKYGRRSYRMSHVDAGVVAQQLHLIATALGLGSCMIAGFVEEAVHKLIDIDGKLEFATLGICVGVPVDAPSS